MIIGRQTLFEQSINDVLQQTRTGKKSSQYVVTHHLKHLVDDLKAINRLPESIRNITDSHLIALAKYWQQKGYSQTTVYLKIKITMRAVRKLNGNVSDKLLDETLSDFKYNIKKTTRFNITVKTPEEITSPLIKDICWLQLRYGLTSTEAMKVSYFNFQYDKILIDRKNAYNGKDRYIRFNDEEDKAFFLSIVEKYRPYQIVPPKDRKSARKEHAEALVILNLMDRAYFRKVYMVNQYHQLIKQGYVSNVALEMIASNTGISDKRYLAWMKICQENN